MVFFRLRRDLLEPACIMCASKLPTFSNTRRIAIIGWGSRLKSWFKGPAKRCYEGALCKVILWLCGAVETRAPQKHAPNAEIVPNIGTKETGWLRAERLSGVAQSGIVAPRGLWESDCGRRPPWLREAPFGSGVIRARPKWRAGHNWAGNCLIVKLAMKIPGQVVYWNQPVSV